MNPDFSLSTKDDIQVNSYMDDDEPYVGLWVDQGGEKNLTPEEALSLGRALIKISSPVDSTKRKRLKK